MRVCSKCGHEEAPYWLWSRWRCVEYTRIENLEKDAPQLTAYFKDNPKGVYLTKHHAHICKGTLQKGIYIERIPRKLYEQGGRSAFNLSREAHHQHPTYKHPQQKTLTNTPSIYNRKMEYV